MMTPENLYKWRIIFVLSAVTCALVVSKLFSSVLGFHPPEMDILSIEGEELRRELESLGEINDENRLYAEYIKEKEETKQMLEEVYGARCYWPDQYRKNPEYGN